MCAEMGQGILGFAASWNAQSGDQDIKLRSYEDGPCGLGSGTLKASHGVERGVRSGSQGFSQ